MKDREVSIILNFKNSKNINLDNIDVKFLESFGKVEKLKVEDKTYAIIINAKSNKNLFVISESGISGINALKSVTLKKEIVKIAKRILPELGLNEDDYEIKSTLIEFKIKYSLKDNVFSDSFKKQIEEGLTKKGYKIDYAGINLALEKNGSHIGMLSISYKGRKDYSNNLATIQSPEEVKDEIKKIR